MKIAIGLIPLVICCVSGHAAWFPDNGDGTYKNPILFADYSDPDVIRVGDDFYLTASSFNHVPGLPILHSKDLVNWTIIGHVFNRFPYGQFDVPQIGGGVWAPSIRYHAGEFYVYYGDPDYGIFMAKTKNPDGPWGRLVCVKEAKGWIDPCPFWDDDGKAYLIHAWAKSRSGINSILTIHQMSPDGTRLLDEGKMVVDGRDGRYPTIEGPKLYKRNGYYCIFAPAGGWNKGYQVVLRSKNILGPYEGRIVMDQGHTPINGPHQGGWVELKSGESWFIHFQDRGGYGRVTHLQPMKWIEDWPVIGNDPGGNGKGEPVLAWRKPDVGKTYPVLVPQTTDDFDEAKIGLQWQWTGNFKENWYSLSKRPGWLRLFAIPMPAGTNGLLGVPNIIAQKFPAPGFTVTAKVDLSHLRPGEQTGLVVLGKTYSLIGVERTTSGYRLIKASGGESEEGSIPWSGDVTFLRVKTSDGPSCEFGYSGDGKEFTGMGSPFAVGAGGWVGARVGLFCIASRGAAKPGSIDVDWFRFGK